MSSRRTFCFTRLGCFVLAAGSLFPASSLSIAAVDDLYEKAVAGTKIAFTASADGYPTPTYRWTKDGVPIAGATNVTLTLNKVTAADAGVYNAIATNSAGWSLSNDLILTVDSLIEAPAQGPTPMYVAPSFTLQPFVTTSAPEYSALTLSASAVGNPLPTYQWRKSGTDLIGATNATLYFPSLTSNDAAIYSVVATNIAGTATSRDSVLEVTAKTASVAPVITGHPSNQSVSAGSAVNFKVVASGTPSPTYQWFKNGAPISGATNPWYTIAAATESDAGAYSASVTNLAGTATSQNAALEVRSPAASIAPVITGHPYSLTIAPDTSASFRVVAFGTPSPTYQWYKDGTPIPGASDPSYAIAAATQADAGTYSVVVTNSAGSVTSQDAPLTILAPAGVAPVITGHPYTQGVLFNSPVTFKVVAFGTPAPTYQWYRNGIPIPGATNPWYSIPAATYDDAGTYVAEALNSAGTVRSQEATLYVK